MATYVIGPLLVLNPPFAKYVLRQCGAADPELAFEEAAMDAYEAGHRVFRPGNRILLLILMSRDCLR